MFTLTKDGQRVECDALDGGTVFLSTPEYFADNVGQFVRRVSYLSWVYREMAEQFFDPRNRDNSDGNAHVVEFGAILLELICDDMKRVEAMRDKAGELRFEGLRSATAKAGAPAADAKAAGSNWVAPPHFKTVEDIARYRQHPRFESAEEVRRAHDLLRAEQAREAEKARKAELTIPLDAAGRLCPAEPPVQPA